jgi:hypothetical protein
LELLSSIARDQQPEEGLANNNSSNKYKAIQVCEGVKAGQNNQAAGLASKERIEGQEKAMASTRR